MCKHRGINKLGLSFIGSILVLVVLQRKTDYLAVWRSVSDGVPQKTGDRPIKPYGVGKEVVYKSIDSCPKAKFLEEYPNPCWLAERRITCAARVMLLGFQKSGTSDMTKWFTNHPEVGAMNIDYFYNGESMAQDCPLSWLKTFLRNPKYLSQHKVAYGDCPGCVLVSRVYEENSTHLVRQSTVQFLPYTMLNTSRYIVTMREPADRMISNFFYSHKQKWKSNPYFNYSVTEVGNSFFHDIVSVSVRSLTRCLIEHGTTVCILEHLQTPVNHPQPYVVRRMGISCYSTFLNELLKFIPKEKIYFSKLEDYSQDEESSMRKIYSFVGVEFINKKELKKENLKENVGYKTKPVLPETRRLLKQFYEPFNVELADMLGDQKWLWK